jgi:hypothetical protein
MHRFSRLDEALDATTSITNAKVTALRHFTERLLLDASVGMIFLSPDVLRRRPRPRDSGCGRRRRRVSRWPPLQVACLGGGRLRRAGRARARRRSVGPALKADVSLASWVEDRAPAAAAGGPSAQRDRVIGWWLGLPRAQRFLLNKLLTSEFRVGVAQTLVMRALAARSTPKPTSSPRG